LSCHKKIICGSSFIENKTLIGSGNEYGNETISQFENGNEYIFSPGGNEYGTIEQA
jgi:hypothetical protein